MEIQLWLVPESGLNDIFTAQILLKIKTSKFIYSWYKVQTEKLATLLTETAAQSLCGNPNILVIPSYSAELHNSLFSLLFTKNTFKTAQTESEKADAPETERSQRPLRWANLAPRLSWRKQLPEFILNINKNINTLILDCPVWHDDGVTLK